MLYFVFINTRFVSFLFLHYLPYLSIISYLCSVFIYLFISTIIFSFSYSSLKTLVMTFYAYFLFFTNHFPIIINLLYTSLIHVLLFTSYLIFFVQDCLFLSSLFPFKQSLFPAFISTIFMTNRRHCVFFYPPFLDVYHLLRFPSNALLSLEIRIEQLFFPTFLPPRSFHSFFYSIPVSSFFL